MHATVVDWAVPKRNRSTLRPSAPPALRGSGPLQRAMSSCRLRPTAARIWTQADHRDALTPAQRVDGAVAANHRLRRYRSSARLVSRPAAGSDVNAASADVTRTGSKYSDRHCFEYPRVRLSGLRARATPRVSGRWRGCTGLEGARSETEEGGAFAEALCIHRPDLMVLRLDTRFRPILTRCAARSAQWQRSETSVYDLPPRSSGSALGRSVCC